MPHPPEHSLLRFLRTARQTHLSFLAGKLSRAEAPVYVIGNPAADLDSIISALVYSYFANATSQCHVPLLNLPNVPSGPELRRLRPEFIKALWLSTNPPIEGEDAWDEETAGPLLRDHIITVADFATDLQQHGRSSRLSANAVLVDWNALPIRSSDGTQGKGQLTGLPSVDFTVVGCVDHHADEQFCPKHIYPAWITTAGSCTSLVVRALESMGAWPSSTTTREEAQVAQLALGPILVDTMNLAAKDKVTNHDTNAHEVLLRKLNSTQPQADTTSATKQDDFYTQILHAKQNSLDLLTVEEMLDRDYKQWTEMAPSDPSRPLHIGFCSMVKSTSWLVQKAGSAQAFLDELRTFAMQRELGIIVVMTAFTTGEPEQFRRELLVCALDEGIATEALKSFVSQAVTQLGLEEWTAADALDPQDLGRIRQTLNDDATTWRRIWVQTDVTKSRKQVAPLVRGTIASL